MASSVKILPTKNSLVLFLTYFHFKGKTIDFYYEKTLQNQAIREYIEKQVPKFSPTFYLPLSINKVLTTVFSSKEYLKNYKRHVFYYKDGGQSALEFYPNSIKHPAEEQNLIGNFHLNFKEMKMKKKERKLLFF